MNKFLLCALFATALPVVAHADVAWKGDFSTGDLSQWKGTQAVSADRLQIVPAGDNPSGQPYALRALVKQGDNPINASGNRNEVLNPDYMPEGSEYYYRWQTKFDPSFPSQHTWQLFTQWHQKADCCGSPPIQFYVDGEEIVLTLSTAETVVWHVPLVRGVWHDFVLHVRFSDDGKQGFLELWYDGAHVMDKTYGVTMANDYLKMGLYRNSTISQDGIVFHTGMIQGTTYEDVVPPAAAQAPVTADTAPTTTTTPSTSTSGSTTTAPAPAPVASATPAATGAGTTPVASNTTPAPTGTGTGTSSGSGTSNSGMSLGGSSSSSGAQAAGCSAGSGGPVSFAAIGLALAGLALMRRRPAAVAVGAKRSRR